MGAHCLDICVSSTFKCSISVGWCSYLTHIIFLLLAWSMLILLTFFAPWRCHVWEYEQLYVLCLLEYSCLLLESRFVIYQSYGRFLKVTIPKMVMAASNLLSAVLKHQELRKLKWFANSFSGNAWAVLIPGQCSLGATNVNSHVFCFKGAAGGGMENAVCAPCCLTKMQGFLSPKPHLVPKALDKGV